ncbi:MAG: hypothetical protein ACYC9M_14045 [Desulfobulbaceae bacterium]
MKRNETTPVSPRGGYPARFVAIPTAGAVPGRKPRYMTFQILTSNFSTLAERAPLCTILIPKKIDKTFYLK